MLTVGIFRPNSESGVIVTGHFTTQEKEGKKLI